MGNIDYGNTLCLQFCQEGEELFNVMGRKRSTWLIKDEDASLLGDGLDDFSKLALASTQTSRLRHGININIETFEQLGRAMHSNFIIDQPRTCLYFIGKKNVLGHSQGGYQTHFLKNHGNACTL